MSFRIERTGPPDGGPARSDPPFPLSTSLTLPARADRLSCFVNVPGSDIYQALRNPCSLLRSHQDRLILVVAHPRPPPVGRVPARHAHTCHIPSGSAAGAVRHPLGQTDARRLAPSLSLTASVSAAARRFRCSAPSRSARLCHGPARFLGSSAECAFPSPPFRFCSLFSALPAPFRLARTRRG